PAPLTHSHSFPTRRSSDLVNPAGAALIPGGAEHERDPGIRTVLFTDIVDSTGLTQRLGDEGAMALLEVHDTIVRRALGESGGREDRKSTRLNSSHRTISYA